MDSQPQETTFSTVHFSVQNDYYRGMCSPFTSALRLPPAYQRLTEKNILIYIDIQKRNLKWNLQNSLKHHKYHRCTFFSNLLLKLMPLTLQYPPPKQHQENMWKACQIHPWHSSTVHWKWTRDNSNPCLQCNIVLNLIHLGKLPIKL